MEVRWHNRISIFIQTKLYLRAKSGLVHPSLSSFLSFSSFSLFHLSLSLCLYICVTRCFQFESHPTLIKWIATWLFNMENAMMDILSNNFQQLNASMSNKVSNVYCIVFAVLVLFGIIPGAMAWSERYTSRSTQSVTQSIVPGGKATLVLVIGGASAIIGGEILELALSFKWIFFSWLQTNVCSGVDIFGLKRSGKI